MRLLHTADWHLGEHRKQIMQRPIVGQEMVDALVEKHNAVVAPDDHVYIIGDAICQHAPHFLPQAARFNGRKTLLKGNHDRPFKNEDLALYFDEIIEEGVGVEVDFGGIACYLVHYPTCGRADRFNLVGHVHGAWKFQLNALNVGVDTNHFAPYDAEEIPFLFNAIKYYDEDIWAAYHESNSPFVGVRGKKGRYFNNEPGT